MKLFEAFAGYGGASFALKKAGIPFELIGFSEIDKYAIKCFEQNHDGKNLGDITKIDWQQVPDFDLLTGGFPCQDISQAGKQDLSKGRSVLVNELIRCLKEKQPKYFLFENVSAIETDPFRQFLREIENDLKRCGYSVFRRCLNSKDFGIPQNRERVWWVGIRKDLHTKDFGWTPFPEPRELKLKLKDLLEEKVDKKYFLREEQVKKLFVHVQDQKEQRNSFGTDALPMNINSTCGTLMQRDFKQPKCIQLNNSEKRSMGARIYSVEGLAVTQNANGGGMGAKTGLYAVGCALRSYPRTGSEDGDRFQNLELNKEEVANSITSVQKDSLVLLEKTRVRRLTPKECFRLMGFLNDEINLEGISDSQKYRLAGNGWEINVPKLIFEKLFAEMKP